MSVGGNFVLLALKAFGSPQISPKLHDIDLTSRLSVLSSTFFGLF
jgi:hypothetical protein